MQTNQHALLPDDNLATKIEELYTIFQAVTKNLSISKPKPMSDESIEILNKFISNKTLRVQNVINRNKELTKKPTKKPTIELTKELTKKPTTEPTNKLATICNNNSHSPRMDQTLNFKIN